jgi:ABC-type transport system involved in multi-copper enzyme maturation permease subunit
MQRFTSSTLAIIRAEILFNSKRAAPYVLMGLFLGNAILWWRGASVWYGWTANSDFYIVRLYGGFTFMTTPFFVALLMGDAVTRDFRLETAPLLLSKPIHRLAYLSGKFLGNFFVLTACCTVYALTLFLLQGVRIEGMIVLPFRFIPYGKHFFILVVISNFALAALCFMVGTLTRSVKLVYGLVTALYGFYIPTMIVLESFTPRWGKLLDPLLFDWVNANGRNRSAEIINQLVIVYDSQIIANRLLMIAAGIICLAIAYWKFNAVEKISPTAGQSSALGLAGAIKNPDRLYEEVALGCTYEPNRNSTSDLETPARQTSVRLPSVDVSHQGWRAQGGKFRAALGVEFRLLRGERSLVIMVPVALLMSLAQLAPLPTPGGAIAADLSAVYAANSLEVLLILHAAVTVFYTGEALHRDNELRFDAILWSLPVPNLTFLLSKFSATFLLCLFFTLLVASTCVGLQLLKGIALVPAPYLIIYSLILLPSTAFMIALSILLQVMMREKYLAYAISIGLGGGLFYLLNQGHHHWLYNPLLYQLWTYEDLRGGGAGLTSILLYRAYWVAITIGCLALAHRFFDRQLR